MKHIAIFENSGDVQTALNESVLENPYVAKVGQALDYNSVVPAPPVSYMGVWSAETNSYTFKLLETGSTYWADQVTIGQLLNVYFQGVQTNMAVKFNNSSEHSFNWRIVLDPGGEASEIPEYIFYEGDEMWTVYNVLTDSEISNALLHIVWNGVDTFTFYSENDECPLSMTTINPEYPAGE